MMGIGIEETHRITLQSIKLLTHQAGHANFDIDTFWPIQMNYMKHKTQLQGPTNIETRMKGKGIDYPQISNCSLKEVFILIR